MPRLLIANSATSLPMGAEVYQEEIAARAGAALATVAEHDRWQVDRLVARGIRSPLPGTRRLPMGWLARARPEERRAVGRVLYRPGTLVHRMNLELPPSPRLDVVTLHDVVAWKFPDETAPVRAAREELRRAAAVICVSEFTAREAVDLLGIEEPHVVPNGVDARFFDAVPLPPTTLAGLGVTGPYVLSAGGASRRKNLEALAAAWPQIHQHRPDLMLVLSGPEHPRRTALFHGLPQVRLVGRVDQTLVPGLMVGASAVVVPSLYEGFGLPALEAMAVGTTLVAARTSALPEVVGDGGILVEPTPSGIGDGVILAVSDDSSLDATRRRGRDRARHFTWENSAAGHAAVWTSLLT